ncbi:cupin domain-containing protein (plasmid) [Roseomonas sp. OT10]|uniref:cupin domain-containing protein n=1 Tax=Roseomonas cutis TaxID=2897332 RepID=UPI001E5A3AB6|nr:cupin domain-containing protein [Roseomonas sp. OT10]UFN51646.1 cupin domain-containing protein [Roseomonas sp. OT10]
MTERLTEEQARARHIARGDMVACKLAFIDCKMPGSHLKENYSLIGAGVTQSADQVVNIQEPHGFSLGAAAMPPGITNNLHVHYTAEVFMIQSGSWTFRWGAGGENEVSGGPGDVVSVPTWIFRGFTNSGNETGWIFTALGGDDTGGIIWHPSILANAAGHGLYLTRDNMMVDTEAGQPKPTESELLQPVDEATIATFRRWTPEQMARRVVRAADRRWSARPLLDSVLPGHAAEMAPVLGHGMMQDRDLELPITNPHGFSVEWLRVAPGNRVGAYRLPEKQVLMVMGGTAEVAMNAPGEEVRVTVAAGEVFSFPAGSWRAIAASGDAPCEMILVTAGDHRKRPEFWPALARAAAAKGWALDHNGYVASLRLLPLTVAQELAVAAE